MSVRRLGRWTAMVLPILFWSACGQVYRPVVIPCSTGGVPGCPVETTPQPSNFHEVFGISTNVDSYPGTAMQIDVSGDSIVGETPSSNPALPNLGDNPTHMAILSNDSTVFVASAGSVVPGGLDIVSSFTPVFNSRLSTGLGTVNTISLPTGSEPVFMNTTQSTAVYVANFGTNSVSSINTTSNVVSTTATVGTNPVALAETPNAFKLYVANQGSNTISSLNPVDLSSNTVTGFTGITPVWIVARGDSQKVYVLTEGDGQLVTIDVATDTVTSSLPVGVGANFVFFDPNLNRLYVTNPVTEMLYVFSATGGLTNGVASDIPVQLASIPFTAGSVACPLAGCMPVSVTALPDGTRFYVASYQTYPNATATTCPDPIVPGPCVVPGLTVFDANNLTVQYPSTPTLNLLDSAVTPFLNQYAVVPLAACGTAPSYPVLYSPNVPRFRVFTTASQDSSRVYVSMCDAGSIAVINTTGANANNPGNPLPPDTVVTDLNAAVGACPGLTCGSVARITSFSISSGVVTFQANNNFTSGTRVAISGLLTAAGELLDGQVLTVLSTGLSATQFEATVSLPDTAQTGDSGTASMSASASITAFSVASSGALTFNATNTLITSISRSAGTITAQVSSPAGFPGFMAGQEMVVDGVADPSFDGVFSLVSVNPISQQLQWIQSGPS
ncbi:MAG: YncE family protein, partial [Candidatus Sulfotelmatobacter sp.]